MLFVSHDSCMGKKLGAPPTYGDDAKRAVILLKVEGKSNRMGEWTNPDGETVKLPSRDTIQEWLDADGSQFDAVFSRQYARACEDNLWDEHEKLRDINRKLELKEIDPATARVMSDNIKWELARRLRQVFGDKTEVDLNAKHSGSVGVSIYLPDNQRQG